MTFDDKGWLSNSLLDLADSIDAEFSHELKLR
jgi:hypothetical protein